MSLIIWISVVIASINNIKSIIRDIVKNLQTKSTIVSAAADAGVDYSASPCINVCVMNPHTALCDGCQRSLDEIAAWGGASEAQKRAIWQLIRQRRAAP
ncbi:DUF1289 domain-containing protein [Collimonas pratensis]|nr:DUF1289 domain-containing protein [Collimonas pratensis]